MRATDDYAQRRVKSLSLRASHAGRSRPAGPSRVADIRLRNCEYGARSAKICGSNGGRCRAAFVRPGGAKAESPRPPTRLRPRRPSPSRVGTCNAVAAASRRRSSPARQGSSMQPLGKASLDCMLTKAHGGISSSALEAVQPIRGFEACHNGAAQSGLEVIASCVAWLTSRSAAGSPSTTTA